MKFTWQKQLFLPQWYAIFINPYFIARRGLYVAVQDFARADFSKQTLLDVGCGSQPYRAVYRAGTYTGIDIAGGGHSDAAKLVDVYYDGEHIPFPDQSFNVVVCTQVLEHSLHPEGLIKEMRRVLTDDGRLFFTVPFVWGEHEQPYDFRRYTSFGLQKLCADGGFVPLHIHATTGIFGTVGQLISAHLFETWGLNIWLKALVAVCVCAPVQLVSLCADVVFRHAGISLDYAVTARKQ